VGAFHITDGAMKRAQHAIETALEKDEVDASALHAYRSAVRRYFESFDREARAHLRDVDRRLEHTNQVAFNLTAERGVAVKRIEGTQAVLTALAGAEDSP
jgi:flavin-dependent dehydrogenase